jgi:hypothetical protein
MDKASIIIMAVALIFSGIMIYEIYILYANADEVKCDSFGNCEFTTILKNSTITESRSCYENGKQVNCSASNVNIEIPKGVFPL